MNRETTGPDSESGERRESERRKAQLPFAGPDQRVGERRSGKDRRSSQRVPFARD